MDGFILSNGVIMPSMAIGTNWMTYNELYLIVKSGLLAGFRAIDTARDYGNEAIVGAVINDVLKDLGMQREDIFITTKIGNSQQREANIYEQIDISLNNLQTNYIDLWLMHWPYPNFYIDTWHKMEDIYKNTQKTRAIGVANYQERHFKNLFEKGVSIIPMVNQIEYHPLRTSFDLLNYMKSKGISLQGYCPLCRFIPQLREANILSLLEKKYNKTKGQIILRWHLQTNSMPIFKSYKVSRFVENIDIFDFSLTEEEVSSISSLDINYKYHLESASCPGY